MYVKKKVQREISTDIIQEKINSAEKIMSLTLRWDKEGAFVKKEIFTDNFTNETEIKTLVNIIDSTLDSIRAPMEACGCMLNPIPYEDLRTAMKMTPILEPTCEYLKMQDDMDYEFSYTLSLADIFNSKTFIVQTTFEKDEIPAPVVLYLLVTYIKTTYSINTADKIDDFIEMLQDIDNQK